MLLGRTCCTPVYEIFVLFGFLHLFVFAMKAQAPSAPASHSAGLSPKETLSREVAKASKNHWRKDGKRIGKGWEKERSFKESDETTCMQRKDLEAFPENHLKVCSCFYHS